MRNFKRRKPRKSRGLKLTIEGNERINKFKVNCKIDPVDKRDYFFVETPLLTETLLTLPKKVDHTKQMTSVKDQGDLGSCVAFAIAVMKEFQEKKEHEAELAKGKPGRPKIYNYSEAWIYWNAKKLDPWGMEEEGTSIRYGMSVLKKIGVPTEKGWPYKDVNNINEIGEPARWSHLVARWALIDSYWRLKTLNEIKAALTNGPVVVGIPVFLEFYFPDANGVVDDPNDTRLYYGDHAIPLIGYNDSTKLFKFKNSWGTSWGNKGYGYLSYQYLRDWLWDAWTAKDLSVTLEMLKGTRSLV